MFPTMDVDGPELPAERCADPHRQLNLKALRTIPAYGIEVSLDATERIDSDNGCESSEPGINEPQHAGCPTNTIRGEGCGPNPFRTNMEHKAKLRIKLRNDPEGVFGAPEIATPHEMTRAAWCDGLDGSGALQAVRSHRQPELPAASHGFDALRVDTDDESTGCDVLVAKSRPFIGCRRLQLGNVARIGIAGYRFDERGRELGRLRTEIESSNKGPALHLKLLIMPGDVFDASRKRSLALPQFQVREWGVGAS